jgi:hypothetical protein
MLHLPTEYYVKRTKMHHVDVIAICKTESVRYNHLETDVPYMSSGTDTIACHKVFQGPFNT